MKHILFIVAIILFSGCKKQEDAAPSNTTTTPIISLDERALKIVSTQTGVEPTKYKLSSTMSGSLSEDIVSTLEKGKGVPEDGIFAIDAPNAQTPGRYKFGKSGDNLRLTFTRYFGNTLDPNKDQISRTWELK